MSPSTQTRRILVCDDQIDVVRALCLLLKAEGYQTSTAHSPQSLLEALAREPFDLILMDLNYTRDTTSGAEGLDLLAELARRQTQTPVIVMTAWGDIDLAVEAVHRGAVDFVQKPWDNRRLLKTLDKWVRLAEERRESEELDKSEIEVARGVQQKLLPQNVRQLPTLATAARFVPASELGGDYYDFFPLGEERLGFVVADVSGKGLPAALLMSNLQALFRGQPVESLNQPARALESINRVFFDSTSPERYSTIFYGVYDSRQRTVRYVNCGHNAPILLRPDGDAARLDSTALVVGLFPELVCEEKVVPLLPDETLLVFTDGVVEASREDGDLFGEDRLFELLGSYRTLDGLLDEVVSAVRTFQAGPPADDCTLVGLRARA